jgi:hypothetical protein
MREPYQSRLEWSAGRVGEEQRSVGAVSVQMHQGMYG